VWYKSKLVPALNGLYESSATLAIINAGFVKGTVSRPPTCNARINNRVWTQSPAALTFAIVGSAVNLTIPRMATNCA